MKSQGKPQLKFKISASVYRKFQHITAKALKWNYSWGLELGVKNFNNKNGLQETVHEEI